MATNNLIKFGDEIFDSDWYELPIEIQKSFILVIANAEKPLYYDGLHMVCLNLPTFAKVSDLRDFHPQVINVLISILHIFSA